MKILISLAFGLLATQKACAQSFQHICGGSTTNGTVVDFKQFNDTIYGTGFFNVICNETASHIATWESNTWSEATFSLADPGHSLEVIDNKLFIAKYKESIDSNWVYTYDNLSLEKFGEGVYLTTASSFSNLPHIYDVIDYNGTIVACGEFDRVGQQSINGIMQWTGTQWDSLGNGLSGNIQNTAPVIYPHQMLVHNSELYVVGNFRYAGNIEVNGVAKWDGSQWSALGAGFDGTVYGITVFNNEIIVGGSFTESGSTPLNNIAKWDGSTWVSVGFGFTAPSTNDFIFVHTLKVIDNLLFISGGLKEVTYPDNSTQVCNGIVSFDGNTGGLVNDYNGGVPGNDIEAIIESHSNHLLVGGGVFGTGYTGILDYTADLHNHSINQLSIFPNPVKDVINISSNCNEYHLFNSSGKHIKSGSNTNTIHFELEPGIYFLKLIVNNQSSLHKVIKD